MKIPKDVIAILESEIASMGFGQVSLTVHLRDKKPRYVIGKERSILHEQIAKGIDNNSETQNLRNG